MKNEIRYMITTALLAMLLLCTPAAPLAAQEGAGGGVASAVGEEWGDPGFCLPFDFPPSLSGNFAELRSNHFHGGLDFKTQGAEGKPVRALQGGYVSRITVSGGGYGNALYIAHPGGYTTLYGHLQKFGDEIARYVRDYQRQNETFAVDLRPDSSLFPVERGQVVALSGNTGYSMGPHLHLEVRRTDTDELINPLLFFKEKLRDTRPPQVTELLFTAPDGLGTIQGEGSLRRSVLPGRTAHCLRDTLRAWGRIGVALRGDDFMDGTANKYGIYSVCLVVDGDTLFESRLNRVLHSEHRLINSWTHYAEYRQCGAWYLKSFAEPGNTLRLINTAPSRGYLQIDEERLYHVTLHTADLHGNRARYSFVIQGAEQPLLRTRPQPGAQLLLRNADNCVRCVGMRLDVPAGQLFDNTVWNVSLHNRPGAVSLAYSLHDTPCPLRSGAQIKIRPVERPVADTAKYYVKCLTSATGGYSVGGHFTPDGWVAARITQTGEYAVAIDTVPPVVTPQNRAQWGRSGQIAFKVGDRHTAVKSYRGTIDGRFALFEYSAKNARLVCRLAGEGLARGRHTLRLTVTDECGNSTVAEEIFNY